MIRQVCIINIGNINFKIFQSKHMAMINEHVREKTNNLGFRSGPTQNGLYSQTEDVA